MKRQFIKIFFLSSLIVMTTIERALSGVGNFGANFLEIHSGARQVAMGEAFTALAYNDINLMRYNIGGLASIRNILLAINYHRWIEDTQQGAIGVALPTRFGVIGLDFSYFNQGELTEFNEDFNPTGSLLNSNDFALALGYGSSFTLLHQKFMYGGGLKFIRQNLARESSSSLGMDFGLLLWLRYLSFGFAMQNFTVSKIEFINKKESMPETIRSGVGSHLNLGDNIKWNLGFDIAYLQKQDLRYYVGTELIVNEFFMIRGGYKIHDYDVNRWAIGLGMLIPMAWFANSETRLDYSYSPLDAFDSSTHRFSLLFRFGVPIPGMALTVPDERKLADIEDQLRKEVEAAQKARAAAEESEKRTRALEDTLRARLERIKKIAAESGGKIEVVEAAGVQPEEAKDQIHLRMRINFDFDKANIRSDEYETMHRIGEMLNTYPESQVFMAGHTDYIGTHEYNMQLSTERVDSVIAFLTRNENVNHNRFVNPIAYGKLRPIADNTTEHGRFQNRRVDFLVYTRDAQADIPDASIINSVELIDKATIQITANGKLSYEHRLIDDPDRLIIDFPKTLPITPTKTYEIYRGPFIRARMGFHPEKAFTRVVFDLLKPIQYEIEAKEKMIIIRVR